MYETFIAGYYIKRQPCFVVQYFAIANKEFAAKCAIWTHTAISCDFCNPRNFICADQLAVVRNIDWANAHCEAAAKVVRRAVSESPSGSWPCMIARVVGKNTKGTTESRALIVCFAPMVGLAGIEPATPTLKVSCSTN